MKILLSLISLQSKPIILPLRESLIVEGRQAWSKSAVQGSHPTRALYLIS